MKLVSSFQYPVRTAYEPGGVTGYSTTVTPPLYSLTCINRSLDLSCFLPTCDLSWEMHPQDECDGQ